MPCGERCKHASCRREAERRPERRPAITGCGAVCHSDARPRGWRGEQFCQSDRIRSAPWHVTFRVMCQAMRIACLLERTGSVILLCAVEKKGPPGWNSIKGVGLLLHFARTCSLPQDAVPRNTTSPYRMGMRAIMDTVATVKNARAPGLRHAESSGCTRATDPSRDRLCS